MTVFFIIFSILIALAIWLRLDYKFGKKRQLQDAKCFKQKFRHSQIDLIITGHEVFNKLLDDIQNAEHHIHMLFYIFRNDHIGSQVLKKLEEKAKDGIQVRLLIDRIGSDLRKKSIKRLRKAGVKFAYSHTPKFPFFFFTLNRRNHRKITVIDGNVGYIGGFNVGDEYLSRDPKFGQWRDVHLRLEGDGVQDLQEQFLQDWLVATNEKMSLKKYYPPLMKGPHELKILPSDGAHLEEIFIEFINQAEMSIYIGTPYFIPGENIRDAIVKATKRGVNVKLIVPKQGDHPLVKEAAFPYLQHLLKSGCNIYRYYQGFYHAKMIVIDDHVCEIGTANIDLRSFHINHEINCLIFNRELIQEVKAVMEGDIYKAERLTIDQLEQRSFFHKCKEKLATLLSPLL